MKARQKCPVTGPTTGCCAKKAPCIDTNIYIHRHTSTHVGMYDCMRSESESELCNQLSGTLRKANKQKCTLVCLCMYMCIRSESESASCSYYFANLSTVSICPSFVLQGGNTITHPHKRTHQGTHVICGMPWKASGCTDVIPLPESSR
jgi:hypothetical protein